MNKIDEKLNRVKDKLPKTTLTVESIINSKDRAPTKKKRLLFPLISSAIVCCTIAGIAIAIGLNPKEHDIIVPPQINSSNSGYIPPSTTKTNSIGGVSLNTGLPPLVFKNAKKLVEAKAPPKVSFTLEYSTNYYSYLKLINDFSSKFAGEYLFEKYNSNENIAVSPLSLYFTLSMLSSITKDDVRSEILDVININYESMKSYNPLLIDRSNRAIDNDEGEYTTHEKLINSLWIRDNVKTNSNVLEELASYHYADSISFSNNNIQEAINDVHNYVRDKTEGVLDFSPRLTKETVALLINTLYLKESFSGELKEYIDEKEIISFKKEDGTISFPKMYQTEYISGRPNELENATYFSLPTSSGYHLVFILPKENHSITELLNKDVMKEVSSNDNFIPADNSTSYCTNIVFPEFKTEEKLLELKEFLSSSFGMTKTFAYMDSLPLLQEGQSNSFIISDVAQQSKISVDSKGIDAAAISYVGVEGESRPTNKESIHSTFKVDRPFVFMILDRDKNQLFNGIINNI